MFFTIGEVPLLIVLLIPVLGWGALRVSPLESLAQLLLVLFTAVQLTRGGIGPLADVRERYGLFDGAPVALLGVYAVTCALVVLPLIVRVGQHLKAERQVAAERDVIRRIVDGARGVAIIGTDDQGLITLFNPGAERLLGYTAAEIMGTRVSELYPPEAVAAKAAEHGLPPDFRSLALLLSGSGIGPTRDPRAAQGRRGPAPPDVAQPARGRPGPGHRLRQHLRGRHRAPRGAASAARSRCARSATPTSACVRSTSSRTPSSPASATSCGRR